MVVIVDFEWIREESAVVYLKILCHHYPGHTV